jgi:hypothetical protein
MNDRLEPRIRILLGSSIAVGPGKATLLEAIGETCSIAAAGAAHGHELPSRLGSPQDHERLFP